MKFIFFIISSILLSISSVKQVRPKFCVNCKFIITDNKTNEYSKCSLFPREDTNYYLVRGIQNIEDIDYSYCSTARIYNHMCGKEGKLYKKKYKKKDISDDIKSENK